MTSSISSWVMARRVAGSDAHSLPPKRRVARHVGSSNQSSLGGTAVAAKEAQQVQSRGRQDEKREVDAVVFPTRNAHASSYV